MKRLFISAILATGILFSFFGCSDDDHDGPLQTGQVGWAIGHRSDSTAAILHTSNGGKTWKEQGDPALWEGMTGNDISAVDEWTAWAAVGGNDGGAILHTSNGGFTWDLQPLPAGMTDAVKGIKGLSQKIAWAVTLTGIVMQTLDGGETWVIIPHEGITIKQVNRMDAKGEDIWIGDYGSGEKGMIHSPDFGQTWRQETLTNPDPDLAFGPMASALSVPRSYGPPPDPQRMSTAQWMAGMPGTWMLPISPDPVTSMISAPPMQTWSGPCRITVGRAAVTSSAYSWKMERSSAT